MVAFIGNVGSGKSSFINSLIGEMKYNRQDGPRLILNGKIALVNQKPWIQSDTIKNNITFGNEFDQDKYDETVKYACLQHDFTVLTNGDQTMIGEKGVNLSGGQKARIALARAIYSNADILLLDDVLSAVDVHVGKSIIKECLIKHKKNTTRILITHALYYMKYMDYIYLMEEGRIALEGSYETLKNTKQFLEIYEKFMKDQLKKQAEEEGDGEEDIDEEILEKEIQKTFEIENQKSESDDSDLDIPLPGLLKKKSSNKRSMIGVDMQKKAQEIKQINEQEEGKKEKGKLDDLFILEDRKKGQVGLDMYWRYIQYNGGVIFLVAICLAGLSTATCQVLASVWMQIWTQKSSEPGFDQSKNLDYLKIYTIFSLSLGVGVYIRITILAFSNFRTAKILHKEMILKLLYAPVNEFFDRVPLGRVLNRLSKDISVMDNELFFAVGAFVVAFFGFLGTVTLCIYASTPWIILPIIAYVIICMYIYRYYINVNREITRLESISKSPLVSFLGESLNGLDSIRAYNRQSDFLKQHCNNVDENKKNQIAILSTNIWFRLQLSQLSLIINASSIAFSLFGKNSGDSSMTGLLLTYTIQIDLILRWLTMNMAFMEQRLVSLERCLGFLEIDSEKGYQEFLQKRKELVKKQQPLHNKNPELQNWPLEGVVEFKRVVAKYRENLDPVLKGVDFKINKQEKVGIVGRTGAGKSTITLCLLRILELFEGQIIIDGQDISKLSLDELRSKITIILQDPQLFEGSLRDNIDPLQEHTDEDIINTLNKCNLEKFLIEREEGVHTPISEGGGNLSVGEKQLLCIARALLKKSKLVLIDEATANIDIQTEHVVQKTIRDVFQNCTVLTIAHRINTILESDRIIVMSEGKVEEFESPKILLNNPNSLFYKLHDEALKENNI